MTRKMLSILAAVVLSISTLQAETLTLSLAFVNQCKNRATIGAQFELDAHLTSPHRIGSSGDDGDVHMAGRAPEVQLPMVVEIMNAGMDAQSSSFDLMNSTPAGQNINLEGVWRIWFEHPSTGDQTQGDPVDVPANSNPDHVFEIHPVTSFGGNDIADTSLVPIVNPNNSSNSYQAYDANTAFGNYEKLTSTISVSDTAVSITAKKAGYNYTEFILEPAGAVQTGDNGVFVLANVYDVSDEETPVTRNRRMVFVDNSEPAKALKNLPSGGRLHVLGIPRVNLAEVAAVAPGDAVSMPLPYEMIVVAVFPDSETGGGAPAVSGAKKKPRGGGGTKKPTRPKK